jgi:positive phototaxis protein PixI
MTHSTLIQSPTKPPRLAGNAYLRFQVSPDQVVLLPMTQVQEVLALPVMRLTSMPNMPACVSGLMNRRSRVLWVIDLAQLLGITDTILNRHEHNLIIIHTGAIVLALCVQQIKGIIWIDSELTQPIAEEFPLELHSHMQSLVTFESDSGAERFPILDAELIANSLYLRAVTDSVH